MNTDKTVLCYPCSSVFIRGQMLFGSERIHLPHTFLRLPNKAVPTRTQVEPSSMAVSRSLDIPIDSSLNPCASDSSRNVRKHPRGASGSSDQDRKSTRLNSS